MPATAELVRVTNNKPSLLHLPDEVKVHASQGDMAARVEQVSQGHSLIPGGNNIPVEAWERYKKHPEVKSWLKAKLASGLPWVTEGGDTSEPEGPPKLDDLSGVGTQKANALIDTEDDPVVLRRWMEHEGRTDLKQLCARRIAAVEKQAAPKKK